MGVAECGIGRVLGPLLVAGLLAAPAHGQEEPECPNPNGWELTETELQAKLAEHERWVEQGKQGPGRANFCNARMRQVDLSGANLAGADFRGADLLRANLSSANLSQANLNGAILAGASLRKANLFRAKLSHADIWRANLSGARLNEANLTLARLFEAILRDAWMASADLTNANLVKADLSGARLFRADLSGADLHHADLSGAKLNGAQLKKAKLIRANLGQAELVGAFLIEADLSGADLHDANLSGAKLNDAQLTKANLTRANLGGADLSGASLTEANLTNAELRKANLTEANLTGAKLHRADLRAADLRRAILLSVDLRGADLRAANLSGSNLYYADLSGATISGNLREADLRWANLEGAVLLEADLTSADLRNANLTGAHLIATAITDTRFSNANLTNARYEAVTAPAEGYLWGLNGLSTTWFYPGRESGIVFLRDALRKAGLRELEREATYAIGYGRTRHALKGHGDNTKYEKQLAEVGTLSPGGHAGARSGIYGLDISDIDSNIVEKDIGAVLEGVLRFVFLELTRDYGLHKHRPIYILLGLIVIMALFSYLGPLVIPEERDHPGGFYRVIPKKRSDGQDHLEIRLTLPLWRAVLFAIYFSLLSTLRFGWRGLDLSALFARLKIRDYEFRDRGWVRVVSTVQSIVSVSLLAIWAMGA